MSRNCLLSPSTWIPQVFSWVRVAQFLVFCVVCCRLLFVLLSFFFWPLYSCRSSLYGFWLSIRYLQIFLSFFISFLYFYFLLQSKVIKTLFVENRTCSVYKQILEMRPPESPHPWFLVCVFSAFFIFALCLVYPILPVSTDYPFLISPLVFSNLYFITLLYMIFT